jgi:two-component system KDP operon response regulator KdpE
MPDERPAVLVVDDEPKIARLIVQTFRPEGFEVLVAHDGEAGIETLETQRPDLVLLDVNMPGLDGFQTCRRIRELSDVPVIMLTSRTAEPDRLAGFGLGADDYVAKPFSPAELVARVRAVLTRARPAQSRGLPVLDDGVLRIDLQRRMVSLNGVPVVLSRIEGRLLTVLATHAGQVLLHEEIKDRVWGADYGASDAQLRTYVKYLRLKIEPDPRQPRYLLSQRGVGYVFRAPRPSPPTV